MKKSTIREAFTRIIALFVLEAFVLTAGPVGIYAIPDDISGPASGVPHEVTCEPSADNRCGIAASEVARGNASGERATVISYKDVRLEVPEGAVADDVEIVIEELTNVAALDPGMENATGGALGYRFKPDGLKFAREIRVTLPYDTTRYGNAEDAGGVYTYFYDEETKRWVKLARVAVDTGHGTVTSLTTHFTDMINSTLKLPESPKPLSFNPTSIKDIKAANPVAGMPEVQGLEAGPFGSATFSIPLTVPPGRVGFAPKLALEYNSESGNGWLGVGFDISVPGITIDTKFGLPKYDGNDTYLLGGSELVRVRDDGDGTVYRQRIEGSFNFIKRFGTNATNHYFAVTDRGGVTTYYGTDDAVSKSDRSGCIYKWFVKRMMDPNGNTINYYYSTDNNYTYLKRISYTGFNGSDGGYSMVFDSEDRNDVTVDCRGKYVSKMRKRLSGISEWYGSAIIRRYAFVYGDNDFGKSQLNEFVEYGNETGTAPDRAEKRFYGYAFEYKSMKDGSGRLAGYRDVREMGNYPQDNIQRDYSFGGGGALYVGVGVGYYPQSYYISGGANIGFQLNYGFNGNTFMDLNGDGLPDYVVKEFAGSPLRYRLNTGSYGFDAERAAGGENTLNGNLMNENFDAGFDVGCSGGAGIVSGSVGGKFNWSFGMSGFGDINGDGFIDYIPSVGGLPAGGYYLRGTGGAFERQDWGENVTDPVVAGTDPNADQVKSALYLVDPVIKWKPYKRGTIRLESLVRKIEDSNDLEYDGVKVDIYRNNGVVHENVLLDAGERDEYTDEMEVDPDADMLYFKVNSIKDIQKDRISWDTRIAYTKLYDKEAMKDRYDTRYDLMESYPEDVFGTILGKITDSTARQVFESFYVRTMTPEYEYVYQLKDGFSNKEKSAARKIVNTYRLRDLYATYTVSEYNAVLDAITNEIDKEIIKTVYVPEYDQYQPNRIVGYELKDGLSAIVKESVKVVLYKYDLIRRYFTYNDFLFDVQKETANGTDRYYIEVEDEDERDLATVAIDSADKADRLGIVKGSGMLYELVVDEHNTVVQKKWLIDKGGDEVGLFVEDAQGYRQIPDGAATVVRGTNRLTIREAFTGYEKELVFEYDGAKLHNFSAIDEDYFTELAAEIDMDPENPIDFSTCYALGDDGYYHLVDNYDKTVFGLVTDKLKERGIAHYAKRSGKYRVYDNACYDLTIVEHPGSGIKEETVIDRATEDRPVLVTSYLVEDDFLADGRTRSVKKYIHVFDRQNDFDLRRLASGEADTSHLLPARIPVAEYRDKYQYLRDRKDGESSNVMLSKDVLSYLYAMDTTGQYYVLDTNRANVSCGQYEDGAPITYGDKAKTVFFNLGYGKEYFTCGVYSWYYGEWNGEFAWDTSRIGVYNEKLGFKFLEGMTPISADPSKNENNVEDKIGVYEGRSPIDAWKGSDFEYSERKGDTGGNVVVTNKYFANYVGKEELSSSRKGGDSVKYVPSARSNKSGISGFLRQGFNYGFNASAAVTPISANYSYNVSSGLKDFMDLNGDRYPDQVEGGVGSGRVTVKYNDSGSSFGSTKSYGGMFGDLRRNATNVIGFGLGLSTEMMCSWFKPKIDSAGNPEGVVPDKASTGLSAGVNIGGNFSSSWASIDWVDINGDGLLDQVMRDGSNGYGVRLNVGDGFVDETWSSTGWSAGMIDGLSSTAVIRNTSMYGGNFGLSIGVPYVGGNIGVSFSAAETRVDMIDINGDGLPDQVYKRNNEPFKVKFNLGYGFGDEVEWTTVAGWGNANVIRDTINKLCSQSSQYLGNTKGMNFNSINCDFGSIESKLREQHADINLSGFSDVIGYTGSFNLSVGINASIPIQFGPLPVTLYISPSGNFAFGMTNAQIMMTDVDGDNLPDHVLAWDGKITAKINNAKMAGLLTKITTPQGGTIELGYEKTPNSVEMPNSMFVLASVTRNDNMGNIYTTSNRYAQGKYDRRERSFCGFKYVTTTNPDKITSVTKTYYIEPGIGSDELNARDYYTKGLLLESVFLDADRRILTREQTTYALDLVGKYGTKSVIFPKTTETSKTFYDDDGDSVTTAMRYTEYDGYGNVRTAIDEGTVGDTSDDIIINIEYAYEKGMNNSALLARYLVALPWSLDVREKNNISNELRYREATYDDYGRLIELRQHLKEKSAYATTRLAYDSYGNLARVTDPNGYYIDYGYDTVLSTYMTRISDAGNYTSAARYDYRFGSDIEATDVSGNTMSKVYDDFGRPVMIFTAYDDPAGTPAVEFAYVTDEFPRRAVTKNKIHFAASSDETLDTVLVVDGLGRVVQTKKEGEVVEEGTKRYGMNVSGVVVYDNMGRVWKQGQPLFERDPGEETRYGYYAAAELKKPMVTTYDALGRMQTVLLPDGSTVTNEYAIADGLFVFTVTDPEGKVKTSYADPQENIVRIEQYNKGKTITTRYEYNLLSEITAVRDTKGNQTTITYDSLGRRTSIKNPDSGLVEYEYDLAGNMVRKIDNNLRSKRLGIEYKYDQCNRLERIVYPQSNPVRYYYGAYNATDKSAGRMTRITDDGGTTEFSYGNLGEQTRVTKTVNSLVAGRSPERWTSEYRFDYLGRMERITYPDGELLTYTYDRGGQVARVTGNHRNTDYTYIADIGYDRYGQRVYIENGNGTRTTYAYDDERRWLANIVTKNTQGNVFQNMTYAFDRVGNIRSTDNQGFKRVTQTYEYDDLYQLVDANGTYTNTADPTSKAIKYNQHFTYDDIGNMVSKVSSKWRDPGKLATADLNYAFAYTYSKNEPHRAIQIGEWKYEYDGNGNVVRISPESSSNGTISGTLSVSNDKTGVIGGTLTAESDGGKEGVITGTLTDATYHVGDDSSSTTGEDTATLISKQTELKWNEENRLVQSTVDNDITRYLYNTGGERTVKNSNKRETVYVDKFFQTQDTVTGEKYLVTKHVFVGDTRIISKLSHNYGTYDNTNDIAFEQHNQFWYHADHLGSTTFVSDWQGREYEHYEYAPYGETWVEEESDQLDYIAYKFTSKELDEETGLYYFGARYLDPKTSRWMSCDPALEKYLPVPPISDQAKEHNNNLPGVGGVFSPVNLNAYHYAGNNPITYTDPTGSENEPWIVISPGHGMDMSGSDPGTCQAGHKEISYIYRLTSRLMPKLAALGINAINIKAPPYNAYTAKTKIDASDDFAKSHNVALHVSFHGDSARGDGFTGIEIFYMTGKPVSKKIAEFFKKELEAAGFEVRIKPDSETGVGRLGELWDTDSPAVLFEIGTLGSEEGRKLLGDDAYMDRMADAFSDAIDKFIKEKPNK